MQENKKRLNRKILTILTMALTLPMIAITCLSAWYQAGDLIGQMTMAGDDLANVVYGGIKYSMSVGDRTAVRSQLLGMQMKGVEVYICNSKQDIIYSTREDMLGAVADGTVYNRESWLDLSRRLQSGNMDKVTLEDRMDGKNYLTTVWLLHNQKECEGCHRPGRDILGSLIVRMATDRTYQRIRKHTMNNILISVIGVCVIIAFTYALLNGLVTGPVTQLARNMRELPHRIAANAGALIRTSDRNDEIGDLEKSFNEMALELRDKQRVIERTNWELAEANGELESFAYSVSHDLRAPLRNIDGFAKILLDEYKDRLDRTGLHYLERVRKGTLRMARLIDDILTFSRAGRQELQVRQVDADFLVRDVLRDFAEDIKTRNITVRIDKLPAILCDSVMIRNVFANLISNAIKYTSNKEHPAIAIGFIEKKKAIFVEDNGVGFDMQYHDKIFQVFQRLQLPEAYEGTGIGLAIAKRIIERHNGSIWGESRPGRGAIFYVMLPTESA